MKVAYTMAPGRGDTDLLLEQVARSLLDSGLHIRGTVQVNTERPCNGPCDMDVRVLPDGPVIRISQSLGTGAKGCRLDPQALEMAVGQVAASLTRPIDALIVNKFGKHEAEGRGFRPVIAEALDLGIPVLVGLNRLNRECFMEFAGDLAEALPPKAPLLEAWIKASARTLAVAF